MNRKQLVILLGLVVVLGGAGLLLNKRQKTSWTDSNTTVGTKVLGDFPVNDVAEITIKHDTNTLTLAKKKDDVWRVRERKDYPANYSEISDFLMKARDLKVVQSEQVGPSQLPRLELAQTQGTNGATAVEFKNAEGKPIRELWLGKKHLRKSNQPSPYGGMNDEGWPDGRYVKVAAAGTVLLISEPFANIEPKPEQWISKDFFKVEKPRLVQVDFPAETNSWTLSRETETGEWKLADAKPGEQLDSSKASSLNSALSSPTINDVVAEPNLETLGLGKPVLVKLETFDNFQYTLKVGTKTNDTYPVMVSVSASLPKERAPGKDEKPEDKAKLDKEFQDRQKVLTDKLAQEKSLENWVYLVSSWSLDSVLKNRSQLMVEKKDEAKTDAAPAEPSEAEDLVPEIK
jgi:hypothetical protein